LARAVAIHCHWQATHRFVLDLPTEQLSNNEDDQQYRQGKNAGEL